MPATKGVPRLPKLLPSQLQIWGCPQLPPQFHLLEWFIQLRRALYLHLLLLLSHWVMSDSLRPNGLQHARLSCPSPTPKACSNSCPLSQWCHPTISSSVIPFFSHLQSFPASGSFLISQFFASGGQMIGISASASVLPMNIQDWFPLGWLVGSPWSLLQHHSSKASILLCSAFLIAQLSHPYMTTGKTIALTR